MKSLRIQSSVIVGVERRRERPRDQRKDGGIMLVALASWRGQCACLLQRRFRKLGTCIFSVSFRRFCVAARGLRLGDTEADVPACFPRLVLTLTVRDFLRPRRLVVAQLPAGCKSGRYRPSKGSWLRGTEDARGYGVQVSLAVIVGSGRYTVLLWSG